MISDFQNDLRNGLTLTEALQKHNITLKQAFQNAPASVDSIISIAANLGADKKKLQSCFDE